ncbi:hypothetical protein [Actinokineospora pegani]|uniref:hypothetical protein n=1 Tax=Actinokineospora pegani TaxID=2654637 RepID=UPI0012E9A58F|nr:hypothetical protein [Actinokineospora pegani]
MAVSDIVEKFPWLRSDPGKLTGTPPGKITELDTTWSPVYLQWLRGSTEGRTNASLVDDDPEADVFAQYNEMLRRDTKEERKAELQAKFQAWYGSFVFDISTIQSIMSARAKQIRDEATAKGEKRPSAGEALRAAGKETAKAVVAKQVEEQRKSFGNVNLALIANLQLKQYQVTALQEFNVALNNLGEAKWDSPQKEMAMEGLGEAATSMFSAYGLVTSAITRITSLPEGNDVPDALTDGLIEQLMLFGESIAAQSAAIADAGRLFSAWAGKATAQFIRDNFASIYPLAGGAFVALRTICSAGSMVAGAFPGYGWIGTVVSTAQAEVELAVVHLVAWKESADLPTQQKYALQTFELDPEYEGTVLAKINKANEAYEGLKDKVWEATGGAVGKKLSAGAKGLGNVVIGRERMENLKDSLKEFGEVAGPILDVAKDAAGVPSLDFVGIAADATGMSSVKAGVEMVTDWAGYYTAIHSRLVDAPGVTEEDKARIKEFMAAPPRNSGFQLFQLRKPAQIMKVDFPTVEVKVGDILMSMDLKANSVTIIDEGMVGKEVLGLAKVYSRRPPNGKDGRLEYLGLSYPPNWGTFKLDLAAGKNTPFHATVGSTYVTAAENREVTLNLVIDLDTGSVQVVGSSYQPMPTGLDGKLEYNGLPPLDGKTYPIAADDLARFGGMVVAWEGVQYTLETSIGEIQPTADWSSVRFRMAAKTAAKEDALVELDYAFLQTAQVISATVEKKANGLAGTEALMAEHEAKVKREAEAKEAQRIEAARLVRDKKKKGGGFTFFGKKQELIPNK